MPSRIYQMLSDARVATLEFDKDDVWNTRISKKKPFECKFLDFASLRKDFIIFFCNQLSTWGHLVHILNW